MARFHKKTTILFSIIALLVVVRLCLPYVVKYYINKTLANDIDGYTGSISDVDLHLYRGAYTIDSLKLLKKEGKVPVPFISADKIDVSIEWKALFDGSLVAEIRTLHPQINFVDGPSKEQTQTGEEGNWRETVNNLFPLQINTFTVNNGEIHFQNFNTSPKVDVYISQLNLVAHNLTNSKDIPKKLASTVDGEAKILDSGRLKLHVETNPLQEQPPFNLDLAISEVPIVKLNDFLKAYANIDMEKGTFALYSEFAGDNGKFKGYVKPIFKDIKVLDVKDDKNKPLRMIWEAGIGLVSMIFKNHREDQVATKIPVSGDLSDPKVDVWQTVVKVLENAFVKAINPKLDGSIDMGAMQATEKEIKKEEKEQKKEERKEKRQEKKEQRQERREERKEKKQQEKAR
jgi:hypothetical protein